MKPMTVDYKPASRAVRSLAGGSLMYNDRLRDGRRSYKVMGWQKHDYDRAAGKLTKLGYTVTVQDAGPVMYWAQASRKVNKNDRQYRLHVR